MPTRVTTQTSVPDGLVAVIDSGINQNHPDLAGRVTLGKDFCPNIVNNACQGEDNDPSEIPAANGGIGHGTFATGVIAATTNNNAGIAGITQSGKVLAVKVFGFDAGGATADSVALSKAIRYAADQNAKVISMSLGVCASQSSAFDTPDKLTENAIAYAVGKGVVLVAAAGNNGANLNQQCGTDTAVQFPGNNPNVIAVGSVDNANARSSFSATGAALDIMAPGEQLVGIDFDNTPSAFEKKTGTSFAAPQVAAVAALMLAKTPSLTRVEVQSILESTAKDLGAAGKDTTFGAGLLQAGAALSKAANLSAPSTKTSVYLYADRLRDAPAAGCSTVDANNANCYDGANPFAGRAVVTINGTSGAVAYSITLSRNGQPIQAGTYRVVACVNKNANATACDAGDLGKSSNLNLVYTGANLTGINLVLEAL
jgi:subtilisin family serine protease